MRPGPDRTMSVPRAFAMVGLFVVITLPDASLGLTRADLAGRFALVVSGVRPVDSRSCESRGSGLYIGRGLYLTAAHVLLDLSDLTQGCRFTAAARAEVAQRSSDGMGFTTRVRAGLQPYGAGTVVADGTRILSPAQTMSFADSTDYAMIRAAEPPGADTTLRLCAAEPVPGQSVIVLLHDGPVATRIATIQTVKSGDDARYVDLAKVFANGTSGAGVFDAETLCVMGLISHRYPEPHPTVTRMTPSAVFAHAWVKALE
jgi:hypothetical protein